MSMTDDKYLICLDLDGTLLDDEKKISLYTENYIKSLVNQGFLVTFVTGRSYRTTKSYYDQLELNTPIVLSNGSRIFNPSNSNDFHEIRRYI